jgi:hypothetical protein
MYGKTQKDLNRTITAMWNHAMAESCANQVEAAEKLKATLDLDRRYDDYDKQRVVERFQQVRDTGSVFDWEDSYLKRGGQANPWSRELGNPRNRRY